MPGAWEPSHRGKKPINKLPKKPTSLKLNPPKNSHHLSNSEAETFCNKDSTKQSDTILELNNLKPSTKTTLAAFINSLKTSPSKP